MRTARRRSSQALRLVRVVVALAVARIVVVRTLVRARSDRPLVAGVLVLAQGLAAAGGLVLVVLVVGRVRARLARRRPTRVVVGIAVVLRLLLDSRRPLRLGGLRRALLQLELVRLLLLVLLVGQLHRAGDRLGLRLRVPVLARVLDVLLQVLRRFLDAVGVALELVGSLLVALHPSPRWLVGVALGVGALLQLFTEVASLVGTCGDLLAGVVVLGKPLGLLAQRALALQLVEPQLLSGRVDVVRHRVRPPRSVLPAPGSSPAAGAPRPRSGGRARARGPAGGRSRAAASGRRR